MSDDRFRGLKAVVRNSLTWGVLSGVGFGILVTTLSLIFPGGGNHTFPERVGLSLLAGLSWGVRFALAGAAIGAMFAIVIRFSYRGRRLDELSPARFALLGAVVGAVGVPLYLQFMNVVFGDGPIAWGLVADDGIWGSIFGATAAAGSIFLARRARTLPGVTDAAQVGDGVGLDSSLPARDREDASSRSPR